MNSDCGTYLTSPLLSCIPFVIHGFGTATWIEKDFSSRPETERFQRVSVRQVHSDIVRTVVSMSFKREEGDALVTGMDGLLLVIRTADCLPVFLVDTRRRVVAAVHCGWRGTAGRLVQKSIDSMVKAFGTEPGSLLAALGPSIEGKCYEVGEEVREAFVRNDLSLEGFGSHPEKKNRMTLDLKAANKAQLVEMGLKEDSIDSVMGCTRCDPGMLSYRADGNLAERMFNFIGIQPAQKSF